MVGQALARRLAAGGFENVLTAGRAEVDLTRQAETEAFLRAHQPETVIVAAAKVGGIHANSAFPAQFIYDNLAIALHLVQASWKEGVKRLLFLGSSCIYPRLADQPMREEALLTSSLEPTNEPYALAKIGGLKLCQYYRREYGVLFHSAMPTNLYGPGDNYHPENSHVIPALIHRFHEAREDNAPKVVLWGTGGALREFLHVDDLADACLFLLDLESPPDWVNVGSGTDVSIRRLAEKIRSTIGYEGQIEWDTNRPDGTPRKLLDTRRLVELGWNSTTGLDEGLRSTYRSFLREHKDGTLRS